MDTLTTITVASLAMCSFSLIAGFSIRKRDPWLAALCALIAGLWFSSPLIYNQMKRQSELTEQEQLLDRMKQPQNITPHPLLLKNGADYSPEK